MDSYIYNFYNFANVLNTFCMKFCRNWALRRLVVNHYLRQIIIRIFAEDETIQLHLFYLTFPQLQQATSDSLPFCRYRSPWLTLLWGDDIKYGEGCQQLSFSEFRIEPQLLGRHKRPLDINFA